MAYSDWGQLTDPVLLEVFSFLDSHDLITAARICKNWYRVSQDESLWRGLVFRRVGCSYLCPNDVTWKSELKRLIYHVPVQLHQTCQEHTDEIFYVCFSSNGELIATCGKDGSVNIWKYGSNTELLYSKQLLIETEYVNYVEFNQTNTHLIVHCVTMAEEFLQLDGSIMVLSITKGNLCPVAAKSCPCLSFRGTWLNNETFLSAGESDVFHEGLQLLACKFSDNDLKYSTLNDLLCQENVETKVVLEINQENCDPEFVKAIDWSEWIGGNSNSSNSKVHEATSEKVVALYLLDLTVINGNKIALYRINLDATSPVTSEPLRIIAVNCLGMQLSVEHRVLVCNSRRMTTVDEVNWQIEKDVITMVISMQNTETRPDTFGENFPTENPSTSTYFFPSISPDYLATESDPDVIFLWDRRSHQVISRLSHTLPGMENAVSAVAFHPLDQEVLITVSDDCKLRIWMSQNRTDSIKSNLCS